MNNEDKLTRILFSGISGVLFIILLLAVKFIDTAAVGPLDTTVGLSHINKAFSDMIGIHMFWYGLTEVLGVLAILLAAAFALLGVLQLVKRKSIKKVDRDIFCLGGLYVITLALYVFFEKVIINYRPVIMPDGDGPEASFPSSHTMLICVVMGSAMMVLPRYINDRHNGKIIRAVCILLAVLTVCGRLLSGVHWLTDILAGMLLSLSLVSLFSVFISHPAGNGVKT